jgi:hypothetical protein
MPLLSFMLGFMYSTVVHSLTFLVKMYIYRYTVYIFSSLYFEQIALLKASQCTPVVRSFVGEQLVFERFGMSQAIREKKLALYNSAPLKVYTPLNYDG